jgi:hypothetical protein
VKECVNAGSKEAKEQDEGGQDQEAANLAAAFVLEWSCDGDGRLF